MATITAKDLDQFMELVDGLYRRGLVFEAYADTLTIRLTGF